MTRAKTMTLPAHSILWAARGALVAASKDDVTPVLTAVHFEAGNGKLTLTSTDRYRVHQLTVPKPKGSGDGEFLVPRTLIEWLLRAEHKPRRIYRDQLVKLTWWDGKPGRVQLDVIAHDGDDAPVLTYSAPMVDGNFPPVGRLFPEYKPDEELRPFVGLSPDFLADLRYLRAGRGEPLRFHSPRAGARTNGLAQPVLVENIDGTARALVQPNLLFDREEKK